jgi:hypothetical protein
MNVAQPVLHPSDSLLAPEYVDREGVDAVPSLATCRVSPRRKFSHPVPSIADRVAAVAKEIPVPNPPSSR